MDQKVLIIAGIVIAIAVAAACIIFAPSTNAHPTSMEVLNKGEIESNGTLYVKLTSDEKISLSGKTIHIKITSDKNDVVYNGSVETHATGVAMVKLNNASAGKYKVDASFAGDENFTECSISQEVHVEGETSDDSLENTTPIQQTEDYSQNQSFSSSYSQSNYYSQYDSSQSSSSSNDNSYVAPSDSGSSERAENDANGEVNNN